MNSHKNSNSQIKDDLQETESEILGYLHEIRTITDSQNDTWVYDYLNTQNSTPPSNNMYPQYNMQTNYYQEFWRTYLVNEMMISKIQEFSSVNQVLNNKLNNLENLHKEYSRLLSMKNQKKNRRTANEIEKSHICPYEECQKLYGSQVSLNLHIKLKHNGGNQTERERIAREIIQSGDISSALPTTNINFPPGYLEKFKEILINEQESSIDVRSEDPEDINEENEEFDEDIESEEIQSEVKNKEKSNRKPLEQSSPNVYNIRQSRLDTNLNPTSFSINSSKSQNNNNNISFSLEKQHQIVEPQIVKAGGKSNNNIKSITPPITTDQTKSKDSPNQNKKSVKGASINNNNNNNNSNNNNIKEENLKSTLIEQRKRSSRETAQQSNASPTLRVVNISKENSENPSKKIHSNFTESIVVDNSVQQTQRQVVSNYNLQRRSNSSFSGR